MSEMSFESIASLLNSLSMRVDSLEKSVSLHFKSLLKTCWSIKSDMKSKVSYEFVEKIILADLGEVKAHLSGLTPDKLNGVIASHVNQVLRGSVQPLELSLEETSEQVCLLRRRIDMFVRKNSSVDRCITRKNSNSSLLASALFRNGSTLISARAPLSRPPPPDSLRDSVEISERKPQKPIASEPSLDPDSKTYLAFEGRRPAVNFANLLPKARNFDLDSSRTHDLTLVVKNTRESEL